MKKLMSKQATTLVDAQRLHAACKRYLDRRENIIAEKKKALLEQVMQERWLELFMRKPRSEEEAICKPLNKSKSHKKGGGCE